MNDHDACIVLNLLNGLGGRSAWKKHGGSGVNAMIDACGSASAILELDAASLSRGGGLDDAQVESIVRWREFVDLDAELEKAEKAGVTILCRTDSAYPASLRGLDNPPLCVYLIGSLPASAVRAIAVVGTRNPTERGTRLAREFSADAVSAGWTTVSGLAAGIDAAGHRAAIGAGGRTVAVLGCGIAKLCPEESVELTQAIIRTGGALVSEYPMDTDFTGSTLTRRNRIIAGLSDCTVVIEAAKRSGALTTAACAAARSCPVFAVPGDADNPVSAGCDNLIRQGATPATSFDDILKKM